MLQPGGGPPPVSDFAYLFRPGRFSAEQSWTLRPERVEWTAGSRVSAIRYDEVARVIVYKARFLGSSASYWTCVLVPRTGRRRIKVSAANRVGLRAVEDRTATYIPFIKELEARIAAVNPEAQPRTVGHWLSRVEAAGGQVAVRLLRGMRRLDFDRTANAAGWLGRRVGPWLRGHRVARQQLELAFPEKTPAEIRRILGGMWDNLARVMVEDAHLDRLWDYDPASPGRGRIKVDRATADRIARFGTECEAGLFFSAHLGNWEFLGRPARDVGRKMALVYRTPPNQPLAEEINRIRSAGVEAMIAAGPDTFLKIRAALKNKWLVGMLIDQHYAGGVEVTFFGRPCSVNATLGRFARMFDCPVYGARVIRLTNGRFQYELTDTLVLPRDAAGKVDVAGTMQMATSMIEGWVREHPEQWMWLHKRWR